MNSAQNTPNVTTMTPPAVTSTRQPEPKKRYGAFVPVLLFGLAVLTMLGWQVWVLSGDREALGAAHSNQQQTVENAGKLRASLDGLAADTQRLAESGNANAALLVTELKKRGITINPNAPAAATAGAGAGAAGR